MALYPGERYEENAFMQQPPQPPQQAPADSAPPSQPIEPPAAEAKPPATTEEPYGFKHAIIDAVASKLGFGTPIRNVEMMKMQAAGKKMAEEQASVAVDAAKTKLRQQKAFTHMNPYLLSVGKETSPHYMSAQHIVDAINTNEDAQAVTGGKHKASDTGEKDKSGNPIYDWLTMDPRTDQPLYSVKASVPEMLDRFYASQDPAAKRELVNGLADTKAKQDMAVKTFMENANASPIVKMAHKIPLTPMEKYAYFKDINDRQPEGQKLSDWQLMEQAGIKQEKEWKPIGNFVHDEDGGMSMVQFNERTGQHRKVKLEGTTWKQFKDNTDELSKNYFGSAWPKHNEMEPNEADARGIAEMAIAGASDPNKKRILMSKSIFEYRDWYASVNDKTPSHAEMRSKMSEIAQRHYKEAGIVETGGGKEGGSVSAEGGKAKSADDKGSWGYYLKESTTPPNGGAGKATARRELPIEEQVKNLPTEQQKYILAEREKYLKAEPERKAKAADEEAKRAETQRKLDERRKRTRRLQMGYDQ